MEKFYKINFIKYLFLLIGLLYSAQLYGQTYTETFDGSNPTRVSSLNRTTGGVQFNFLFTADGDGGDFVLFPQYGVSNSPSLDLRSYNFNTGTTEKITISRTDGQLFVFTSLFVRNDTGTPITVQGYRAGSAVGASTTITTGQATTVMSGAVVDQVLLTATDFFNVNIDDFSWSVPSFSAPTVSTATASSIAASSATLGGNVTSNGGATVTTRGVVYSSSDATPTLGEGGVTNLVSGSGTGSFSEEASGLSPATTYYYQAYATNSVGTSYGGVQTFSTTALPVLLNTNPILSFSNTSGFGDKVAEDGDGGSVPISDINLLTNPINSSGSALNSALLEYHDGTEPDWSGYPAIIVYGAESNTSFYGWSIKSGNGAEFALNSLDFHDWGNYDGATFRIEAYKDGASTATYDFTGNTDGSYVSLSNPGNLPGEFSDVDEIRIYQADGADSFIALNNIGVGSPVTALPNTSPVASAPSAPTVNEDEVNVALPDDIHITDVDGNDQTVSFTITGGTLTLGTTGITFAGSGNGSASFTASGTLASINAALDAATFTPTPNLYGTGAGTISFYSNDGTEDSNTAAVTFDIAGVNDDPTFVGIINSITVVEDEYPAYLRNALSSGTFEDIDAGSNDVSLTIATSQGNIAVANPAGYGISQSGHNTPTLTLTGPVSNIESFLTINSNAALILPENLSGPNAVTITLTANDNGNVGANGGTDVVVGTVSVTITPVNDAPVAVDDNYDVDENTPQTGNVLTNDTDPEGNALIASLVTAPVNGTVVLNADGSFTYTPSDDYSGSDSLVYQVCDNGVPSLCDTATVNFDVKATNSAPVIAQSGGNVQWTEGNPPTILNPIILISDSDDDNIVKATIHILDYVPGDVLNAGSPAPYTANFDINTGYLTLSGVGTAAEMQAALRSVGYRNSTNNPGQGNTDNIRITNLVVEDTKAATSDPSNNAVVLITSVNDAPSVSISGSISVMEDSDSPLTGISFADADAGSTDVTTTFSIPNGTLSASSGGGVTVTGSGTGNLSLDGSLAAINSFIADSNLSFLHEAGNIDDQPLTVAINDNGNTGTGGALQDSGVVTVTVTQNPPTVTDVTVPANGTYGVSQNLDFTVNFDESISVNTGGGIPGLSVTVGSSSQTATFISGSGTTALVFRYTVQNGDLDANGIQVTALSSNGGTLTNGSGTGADLSLNNIGNTSGVLVDGIAPSGYSVTIDQDPILSTNQEAISFTFAGAEIGASYRYTFSSSGGGANVSGSGTISSSTDQISGIDLSSLIAGTITLAATLEDAPGNLGSEVNDTSVKLAPISAQIVAQSNVSCTGGSDGSLTVQVNGGTANYSYSWSNGASTANSSSATNSINSLPAGSYSVTIIDGNGQEATVLATITEPGMATVTTSSASNITSSSAELGGTVVYNDSNCEKESGVVYSTTPNPTLSNIKVVMPVTAGSYGQEVTGLQVNTTYYVRAFSTNDNDVTSYGNDISFTTSPKVLTVIVDAGQNKVYGDSDPTFTYTVTGFENGDDESILSGALTREAGEDVGTYAIQLGSLTAGANYTINFTGADFTVGTKVLTVTADAGQSKVYGATDPTFIYTSTGFANGDDESILSGTLSREAGEDVGTYSIELGSLGAGTNYTINFTGADFTVGTKVLTVTADAGQSKAFGSADPTFTYTATGFASGDDESILSGALSREAGENVGTYTIQLGSLSAGANYAINFTGADFAITPTTLNITADAGQSKVYGDTDPIFTYTATGFESGDDESILSGALSREAGEDVGTYAIQLGSLSAGSNYTINFTGADFAITPATLNITADAGQSKVYGSADPTFTYTATGFANGDDESILNGALTREAGEEVGTYAIQLGSLTAGNNYTINFAGADFAITPATLNITADAGQSKVYGSADPTFTYTSTGFSNGDDESILSGALSREAGENVGTYAIQLGSLSAGANYTINFTGADFAITPATLNITADAGQSKVYGSADPTFTYTATGFANGDDESILSGALSREAGENVGTYAIQLGSLTAGANYTINFTSADFTIGTKVLTVTADAGQSKVYGSADPTFTYTATGFANGDDESILSGALTREAGEEVGTYAIQLGSLTAGNNYTINFAGADFAITPATLMINADAGQSKVYGDTDPVFIYTATGFENGDDESVLSGALSREAGEAVGTYAIQLGSLTAGSNYTINFVGADFTIGNKVLTVTADASQSKVYGDTDPVFTYTATGFANGDDESILSGALSREAGEAVGTYAVQLGSLSAGTNYTINFVGADFTIGNKVLTVTADAGQSKVYGATDPVFTYTSTGFENGDDESVLSGALSREAGEAVGTYAIQLGSLSAGTNYTINFVGADFTIGNKVLTVTADAGQSKIYGATDPVFTYTATGFENGDDESVLSGALSREAGEAVGTYAVQLGSLSAGTNYTINFVGADFTIGNKVLTVTADAGQSKVYGATDPVFTYTATGFENGDDESVLGGALSREAGEAVGTYAVQLGSLSAGANYIINFTGADFAVTTATLNILADAGQSKVYGATDPVFTYTATGFANGDDESILSGALSREAGENVGTYAIQLGSLSAGANYTINFTSADFTIGTKVLTVTADAGQSKVYGDTDPTFTYTATGFANDDDESILSGALSREAGEAVGSYAIQLGTLSAGANYAINFTGADFAIGTKVLTVTTGAGQSKVYGATDPILTYTASGLENGDDESILSGALTREAGEDVGTYAIQLGSLTAGANYTINFTGADFTIGNKVLTVTADAGQSKVYGSADPTFTYAVNGFANGDDESIMSGALTREAGENVGTYAIQLGSLSAGANYTINFTGADFTVGTKVLTVTADAGQSKVYGSADPTFTYTSSGFANGDDESILSGALSREAGEAVGSYAIQLGTLSAGANYSINFVGADFTIGTKVLTVTADAGQSKVYGSADPTFTYTSTGFANGDDESILSGALSREAGENVGTYAIQLGSLSAGANYSINFTGADFTIGTKVLTVTADAGQSKVYGAADPTLTYTASGFANGDDESILSGALTREAGEAVGTYAIQLGSLSAGANYTINYTGADFAITPATLAITADAGQSKVYGAADPTFTYTVNGFANGDDESILSGALTREAGEDVGTYAIQLGSLSAGANYTINFTSADFTIGTKVLTVTADAGQSKVYGTTDPTFSYTVNGFANGDDESILSGALTREAGEAVGTYAIQLGSLSAGANYTINFTGADFTIGTKVLTVTADAGQSKVYGATDPTFTYTATGFASGDDESILSGALSREAGEDVGTYAIQLGSLTAGANYTINFTGADFAIGTKVLTVTADAGQSKVYGSADPTFTYTVTGFANGDDESVLSGTLTREAGEDVGTYAIQLGSLSAGSNYTINFTGADFTIGNKVLTVTADAGQSKAFGSADPTFTYTATGFANGDDESILSGALSREAGEDVGTYAIQLGSLSAGNNYTINFTGADFAITPATLNITADAGQSKVYGSADPTFTYTSTGFANGDNESILSGALSREAGENVGSYAIQLGSLSAGASYTINFTGAVFNIVSNDSDGDGVPDDIEDKEGSDPDDPKDYLDTDGDEVPDYVEDQKGTDPNNGSDYPDTDNDKVPDYVEERDATDPTDPQDFLDTDNDGVADYVQERSIKDFVPQTISVAWGTPVTDIPYPTEVVAVSSQDEFINIAVSWNLEGFDPMISGTAPYTGLISEAEGLFNAYSKDPMLEITVQPKPAPEDVTLGNNEFIGNPDVFFQEIGAFTVVDPLDDVHEFVLPEGEGDNGYFEVKSGILFWSSADEAAGRTDFTIVLKVTDRAGNELVKSFTIRRLRTPLKDLELFNTFTPNEDGINDTWGVPALRYYSGVRIQVFDNGGQRLFYTEDADARWDGKYGDKELPVGAYFYVIEVRETGETRRGTLNLLRE